ncbi:hypothetical protein BS47DRAFT_1401907 [Hydnum rufescens UP504]|uniref:Uncharacterized protein n=1 Tax=Hydnum rufescens UP504 TaxID=1448309 RepID=A0A9P6AEM9_9AGAM|nr:hypothetical protein BS47DRAFT_1401907 [Hydnum rufescens UP504]
MAMPGFWFPFLGSDYLHCFAGIVFTSLGGRLKKNALLHIQAAPTRAGKLERWGEDDADDDTAVPLVIDRDGNAVCCVQDAGLDFGSESTTTSTRQPKLTSQKSQKVPASAAKSKGIARSTRIQSKPFIDESDSDSLDFDNPMALAKFEIGSSSKLKIGASSEFEFELFGNFKFGLFNGFEFGTFSDFEFGSFGDIKFKSCGHDAPWCWSRWCLEL